MPPSFDGCIGNVLTREGAPAPVSGSCMGDVIWISVEPGVFHGCRQVVQNSSRTTANVKYSRPRCRNDEFIDIPFPGVFLAKDILKNGIEGRARKQEIQP